MTSAQILTLFRRKELRHLTEDQRRRLAGVLGGVRADVNRAQRFVETLFSPATEGGAR